MRRTILVGASLTAALAAVSVSPTDTATEQSPTPAVSTAGPKQSAPTPQTPTRAETNSVKLVVSHGGTRVRWQRRKNRQAWMLRKHGGRLVAIHLTR